MNTFAKRILALASAAAITFTTIPAVHAAEQEAKAIEILKANGVDAYTMGVIVENEEKVILE